MFLYNTFQWPWTRIAGLVAPRPMLFVNSDNDRIFPMDANERISNRLERLYSLSGTGDRFDTLVSVGGHAYREDIRQGAFRFLNAHLKGDARPITDSEIDVVSEGGNPGPYPIVPERLRVFPADADLPADQLNTKIDEHFVPIARPAPPEAGKFEAWKKPLLAELRRVSFGYFPETIPAAKKLGDVDATTERLQSEEHIEFRLRYSPAVLPRGGRGLLVVLNEDEAGQSPEWAVRLYGKNDLVFCEPRGIGETRWTRKNGPNYVERSHALLGRTVDAGRVWDVIAAAKYLAAVGGGQDKVVVAGKGPAGLTAAYAAALVEQIAGVTVIAPPKTHMDNAAPQLLNVLRVCDVPDALGLVAPRPLTLVGASPDDFAATKAAYAAAGAAERLTVK
jgi:predicted alpha/beta hydrolase family esterase